ncbi:unnamed protein product [Lactuca virosa]|uniref:Transcription initiation factor TFIID subunit 13 n=1 Tax=Lactuca virosa TaxID=75947 RepID=A0AAU9LK18_9ASTR|nr:unnamed protein product [Lactuca virosa]
MDRRVEVCCNDTLHNLLMDLVEHIYGVKHIDLDSDSPDEPEDRVLEGRLHVVFFLSFYFFDMCLLMSWATRVRDDHRLPNSSTGYLLEEKQEGTSVSLQNQRDYREFTDNMNKASAGSSSKVKEGSSHPSEASFKRKRGVFQKDLQHMMYGFGDDSNPLPETVALMEDIVMEYVTDMVHKAQDIASKRGKLLTEDFLFLIRKDLPKLNRCTELLSMNEELKQARKAFDVDEEKLAQPD